MTETVEAGSSHIVVLTTVAKESDGRQIARALVERRLAGCVNVLGPMRSIYRWKGEVQEQEERLLLIKTVRENFERLALAIREVHPYELPELIALPLVEGEETYLNWLTASSSDLPGELP